MRDMRQGKGVVVRRLERGDLRGMDGAIPTEWMPRHEAAEPIEEPASLAGWSWGAVAPRAVEV